ncbi:MAG TPA: DUF559 domain-containing protein, partial [Chitinophagales bacterium]|nr:DUF559 domain-containing protein [Chitinophagales bacterium]
MKTDSPFVAVSERVYNNPELKARRKELGHNSTNVENVLWDLLRDRRLGGWRFRRQFSVGSYVLDFYCPKARLNVEVGGSQHFTAQGKLYNVARDGYMRSMRIDVLRF